LFCEDEELNTLFIKEKLNKKHTMSVWKMWWILSIKKKKKLKRKKHGDYGPIAMTPPLLGLLHSQWCYPLFCHKVGQFWFFLSKVGYFGVFFTGLFF
jgi:hypothetical protein